jgi:hypothetical protein
MGSCDAASESGGFATKAGTVGSFLANPSHANRVFIQMLFGVTLTIALILLSVGIHYEVLSLSSNAVRKIPLPHRIRVAVAVLSALGAHFLEIIVFTIGWKLLMTAGVARLSIESPTFLELLYFSSSTYTSLGYGDIVPIGNAGILAGCESLTGLVLIAWTASFTYFEMHAFWDDGAGR